MHVCLSWWSKRGFWNYATHTEIYTRRLVPCINIWKHVRSTFYNFHFNILYSKTRAHIYISTIDWRVVLDLSIKLIFRSTCRVEGSSGQRKLCGYARRWRQVDLALKGPFGAKGTFRATKEKYDCPDPTLGSLSNVGAIMRRGDFRPRETSRSLSLTVIINSERMSRAQKVEHANSSEFSSIIHLSDRGRARALNLLKLGRLLKRFLLSSTCPT